MKTKVNIIIILMVMVLMNILQIQVYAMQAKSYNNSTMVKLLRNEESSNNISIAVNQSRTIIVSIFPDNASNKKLSWKSSNNKIATVSSTGKVKGIKTGTCIVTVKTCDSSNKSIKYTINVKKRKTRHKFYYKKNEYCKY